MFFKRLSTAFLAILCFSGFVLGASPEVSPNVNRTTDANLKAAPLDYSVNIESIIPVSCYGYDDGYVDFSIQDGIGPYEYRLENSGNLIYDYKALPDTELDNLSAGSYRLYVKDLGNLNNVAIKDFQIAEADELKLNLISFESPQCSKEFGSIVVSSNQSGSTFYINDLFSQYNKNNITGQFDGLPSGTYEVSAQKNSCTSFLSQTITIDIPDPIDFSPTVVKTIDCDNGKGSVQLSNLPNDNFFKVEVKRIPGDILYSQYILENGNRIYTNLDAGTYSIAVLRENCSIADFQNKTVTIEPFNTVNLVASPASPVTLACGGENDLTDVEVTVSGGRPGFKVRVVLDNNNGVADDLQSTVVYGSTVTFPNIEGGTYTIRWYDDLNPTCFGSQNYVINAPATPLVFTSNPVQDAASCYGENNGTVDFEVTGGVGNYTYYIDGTSYLTPANIILSPGNHSMYVEDENGCTTADHGFFIEQTPDLVFDILENQVEQLTCVGGNSGRIPVKTTGGNYPYFYTILKDGQPTSYTNWQGDSVVTFSGLAAGVYDISVTDGICSAVENAQVTIDPLEPITVTYFLQNPSTVVCRDQVAELIFIQAHGGPNVPFTYSLYRNGSFVERKTEAGHEDGVPFYNIAPANYTVWIKYNGACDSIAQQINIYNPQKFTLNYQDTLSLSCYGDAIALPVLGSGEAPFTYTIEGVTNNFSGAGGTSAVISNLAIGANTITFEDRLGCQQIRTVFVDQPEPIDVNLITANPQTNCVGSADAVVTLQVTGGTPAFQVEIVGTGKSKLTDNNGMVTFNLAAGAGYDVLVTDIDKGCVNTFTDVFSVAEPPSPFVISEINITQQDLLCYGDSTRVEVNVAGGWGGDYKINVQGGGINKDLPANGVVYLKAGTYNFRATNLVYGCTDLKSNVVISEPRKLVLNIANSHNVSCFGADDADIGIQVSGGTTPYYWGVNGVASTDAAHEFSTSNFLINNTNVSLVEGVYDVVVEDANGCVSNIKPVTISEPAPITFEVVKDTFVSCFGENDASITLLNISGGNNRNYQSLITIGASEIAGTPVIPNLGVGTYSIRVVDGSGACYSDPINVEIKEPSPINWLPGNFEVDHIKCFGVDEGRIKIDAAGGLPFTLEYRITNGSYDSGYSPINEFTDLAPGSYTAYVRNSRGNCEMQYAQEIAVQNVEELIIPANGIVITDVSCHNLKDGSVIINATGGTGTLTYTLTNALSTVDNNPNNSGSFVGLGDVNKASTTYNYRVQDLNQCYIEGSFTVVNPPQLEIAFIDKTNVTCHNDGDGTISVSITGGRSPYSLSDMNQPSLTYQIENVSADEFKLIKLGTTAASTLYLPTVTDASNCVASLAEEVEIVNPDQVRIEEIIWGDKLCFGDNTDSTIIIASGGTGFFRYSLDDGITTSDLSDSVFIGEATGTKFPYVVDENGCSATDDPYEYIQPDSLNVKYKFQPILCFTDTFANMKLDIVGGTGPYYLSINDPNFENTVYEINPGNTDTTKFDLRKNNIALIEDIKYNFYLKDINDCPVNNIPFVVEVSNAFADTIFRKPPELILLRDSLVAHRVKCSADNTGIIQFAATGGTVTASKGYTLKTVNESNNFIQYNTPLTRYVEELYSGLHKVYLTDANNCKGRTSLTNMGFDFDTITVEYSNKSILVNVSDISLPNCNDTYDGVLEIDIQDYYQSGATAYVLYEDSILQVFNPFDDPDTIPSQMPFISDDLYYANNITIAEGMGVGNYRIMVQDNYTLCQTYIDTMVYSLNGDSCPPTYFYNVFTPHNSDDLYENWTVFGSQHQKYKLQVYTAWGDLVYTDEGTADGDGVKWNGVDNRGNPVPVGTYIYLLEKNMGTPRDTIINGNVTVIRDDGRW